MGILSYLMIDTKWYLFFFQCLCFLLFGVMFLKMSKKHTKRIIGYEDERPFWNFFDKKAYVMMACMMGGGIGLRALVFFPDIFVAFFIQGLDVH